MFQPRRLRARNGEQDCAQLGGFLRWVLERREHQGALVEREREQLHLVGEGTLEPVGQVAGAHVTDESGELVDGVGRDREARQHHLTSLRCPSESSIFQGQLRMSLSLMCSKRAEAKAVAISPRQRPTRRRSRCLRRSRNGGWSVSGCFAFGPMELNWRCAGDSKSNKVLTTIISRHQPIAYTLRLASSLAAVTT